MSGYVQLGSLAFEVLSIATPPTDAKPAVVQQTLDFNDGPNIPRLPNGRKPTPIRTPKLDALRGVKHREKAGVPLPPPAATAPLDSIDPGAASLKKPPADIQSDG